ncbi:mannose-1-phosphate guanylyltransferase [Brachybacterium squillarum]|uniref:mannose-1-phosphate guanylyltransferase n=1 Tax=Brachybacterium squillarum TaxID=661979 RepID=UPI00222255EF|nr:mannose-1-phosphate guanylyltransferase [Brachybacterium squillarum]MCW1806105.1 sugar phosphate nucleotidyltransferase [Brachybacterium squillarum]
MPEAPFVPVIPAGGSGTRLWPLSRRERPKFLLDLTGTGASLLEQTLERLLPLADAPPVVVTGAVHRAAVEEQAAGRARVIAEPSPRNSMPAIALAAAVVERETPDAVIGSFAADHLVADTAAFAEDVRAARAAAEDGHLVTLGIVPTHPATGFGYIERSTAPVASVLERAGALPVSRFVEKPTRDVAEEFLASGRFLWNAGMFVVRARVLLDELAVQIPPLAEGVRRIAAARGTEKEQEVLDEVWPSLLSIAIDHALAEPLAARGRVAVVPARFDWDDVGDFAALARQLRSPAAGGGVRTVGAADGTVRADGVDGAGDGAGGGGDVRVLGTATVDAVGSRATVYGATHRHVALVGLDGITVVDAEDALLVLDEDHAQELTRIVSALSGTGRDDLR